MNVHHIMTLYYQPTDEAKKTYDGFKEQFGDDMLFVNCGSIDRSDDWVKKNVVFEADYKDNISKLNPHWCELTTYYLVWKNMLDKWSDDDYVQHSHYRKWLEPDDDPVVDIWACGEYPMKFRKGGKTLNANVESGSLLCHPPTSWAIMEQVVLGASTWRQIGMWNEWKSLPVMVAPMNLFKMRVRLFKEYCEWLFPKAFEIEKRIPYDHPDYQTAYQRRALAFISERLFSFWCFCKWKLGCCIKEVPNKIVKDFKPITDEEERGIKL